MSQAHQDPVSVERYLQLSGESVDKLNYWDGLIFAMAGAQPNHNRIQANVLGELRNQLTSPCEVFGSDQRIKIDKTKYWYPDAVVACDSKFDEISLINPSVVVEVLSPSTAGRDRIEKVGKYTSLESIVQVILINQDYRCVESYHRVETGWQLDRFETGVVSIASCEISIDEIYRNVRWKDS